VGASVGYTGGESSVGGDRSDSPSPHTPTPTYESVCDGDGHAEAVRVEFDPSAVGYEELVRRFVEDPRVPTYIHGREDPQYRVAIWTSSEDQREIAMRVRAELGKDIPVLDVAPWYDAECSHQNFFGC